jgi:hypothetical protein
MVTVFASGSFSVFSFFPISGRFEQEDENSRRENKAEERKKKLLLFKIIALILQTS